MNETKNTIEISVKELWDVFVQRLVILVLVAVIAVFGSFLFDRITYEAQYESTASMYILRDNASMSTSTADAYNEFNLALKMVNDCTYMLKSRTVLEAVIDELGLDYTYEQLYKRISTENPENTRILEVTVQGDSAEQAKRIVDRLCEIGQANIDDAMGFSQITLYEYGNLPEKPCNKTGLTMFLIIGVAAAILTYGVFLVIYLLDDRIRSEEDIERYLGLTVLGEIPDLTDSRKRMNAQGTYGKSAPILNKIKSSGAAGKHERRS